MLSFQFWRSKDSFTKEILEFLDPLYATAMRLTKDPANAEDLVQEAILKAYKARKSFAPGSNRKAWLFKIMMNTFINQYHRNKREKQLVEHSYDFSEIEDRFVDDWSESNFSRQHQSFTDDLSDEVKRAFDELAEPFRTVVELVDLQDFSYAEVAEIVGCPIGTVMSRLARGRNQLQSSLREYAIREGVIKVNKDKLEEKTVTSIVERKKKGVGGQ